MVINGIAIIMVAFAATVAIASIAVPPTSVVEFKVHSVCTPATLWR